MKKLYSIFIALTFLMTLSGCKKDESPALQNATKRTVVAYLFGDVNLWEAMVMSVNQMEAGWNPETNGTLLVYLDASPHLTQFGAPVLLEIQHDKSDLIASRVVRTYPDRDAADPKVFAEVLRDAAELYPADSHGLILGGHGSGWLISPEQHSKSIGNSERFSGPFMDIDVLAAALPIHYDFIVFHACLMAESATFYQLRDKTDYVVASVESLPVYAYPYHLATASLFTQPNADLHCFVTQSQNYYTTEVPPAHFSYATFGVYRMAAMEALAAQTKKALERLNNHYPSMLTYAYDATVNDPQARGLLSYPHSEPQGILFFDFGVLYQQVKSVDVVAAEQLRQAVGKVAIIHRAVSGTLDLTPYAPTLGLSYYIPYPAATMPMFEPYNKAFYTRFGWSAASGFTSKWE